MVLVTIGSTNILVQASRVTVVVVSGLMTFINVDSSCIATGCMYNLLANVILSSKLLPIFIGLLLLETREAVIEDDEDEEEKCVFTTAAVDSMTLLQEDADIGEEHAKFVFALVVLLHNFEMINLGVMRPSYVPVPESGLGHTEPEGDWHMGEDPRLSQNIFFAGG